MLAPALPKGDEVPTDICPLQKAARETTESRKEKTDEAMAILQAEFAAGRSAGASSSSAGV